MDDESGDDDRDELTSKWGDMTGEADGMNPGVDSRDGVMHIWMSDLWFSTRRWLVGENGWQQMRSGYCEGGWTEIDLFLIRFFFFNFSVCPVWWTIRYPSAFYCALNTQSYRIVLSMWTDLYQVGVWSNLFRVLRIELCLWNRLVLFLWPPEGDHPFQGMTNAAPVWACALLRPRAEHVQRRVWRHSPQITRYAHRLAVDRYHCNQRIVFGRIHLGNSKRSLLCLLALQSCLLTVTQGGLHVVIAGGHIHLGRWPSHKPANRVVTLLTPSFQQYVTIPQRSAPRFLFDETQELAAASGAPPAFRKWLEPCCTFPQV